MLLSKNRLLTIVSIAGCVASSASAQVPITVIPGFTFQTWNAGTSASTDEWRPESPGTSWADGLRWTFQNGEQVASPVFDPAVPGITKAFNFPAARAATINPDDTGNRGANWENNATAGESATFEIWFRSDDLNDSHVLFEIGAVNKGVAVSLQEGMAGTEIVYSVAANDGAGGNSFSYEHREPLADTEWHQAVITINFANFRVRSFLDGVQMDSQDIPPSGTYRWTGANPAGLGTLGSDPDPLFSGATIAGGSIDAVDLTDFNGQIGIFRFYDVDLFDDEVADNYDAITDMDAARRRNDFNGDGFANTGDLADFVTFISNSTNTSTAGISFPFPSAPGGGVQTNDPVLDETFVGDFSWNLDSGFNPTSQEPTFQFPAINVLEPVAVNDLNFPSIRGAFLLNGMEALRGPKFEQADDTSSVRVQTWFFVEDLVGNHCLFEAGGSGVGFSMVSVGDELQAFINTSAVDGRDILEISSGTGVLQTGWHLFEVIIRRFTTDERGQGLELYMDGALVASANDGPGPDGIFNTEDDNTDQPDNIFTPGNGGNSNFIGGNQGGLGQVQGTAALPSGATGLTPFNGMVGPFRMQQLQPLPSEVMSQFMAESSQDVINARSDINGDGAADAFDALDGIRMINAGL